MSVEVHLQRFERGEPSSECEAIILAMLSHVASDNESGCWHIAYDDLNNCDVYVSRDKADPSRVTGLTISRPCGDGRLWDSIYAILSSGPWVMYYPASGPSLIVTDERHCDQLPVEMLEAVGPPRVVRSGTDIIGLVTES